MRSRSKVSLFWTRSRGSTALYSRSIIFLWRLCWYTICTATRYRCWSTTLCIGQKLFITSVQKSQQYRYGSTLTFWAFLLLFMIIFPYNVQTTYVCTVWVSQIRVNCVVESVWSSSSVQKSVVISIDGLIMWLRVYGEASHS